MRLFGDFEGHDRFGFPEGIFRVTAGRGGEALLIFGSEKTALLDCGMAYCAEDMIENIKDALCGRPLDYIVLSHTHYDHIGALPFIRREWPEAVVFAAAYAKEVLGKPGAIRTINSLSEKAWALYDGKKEFAIPEEGFSVDRVLPEGSRISLGREELVALETKGHTDCSLTFVLEPAGIMFLSESTGVLESPVHMHVSILKNYDDSMRSIEKCRNYGAKTLISPHYGLIPEDFNKRYFDLFVEEAEEKGRFLRELYESELSEEEILSRYAEKYWQPQRETEQPRVAFLLNARNIIKVYFRKFEKDSEDGYVHQNHHHESS